MSGPDDEASTLLSGRFRLGELLGTGGSASVFAAVDTRDGSDVALKILHPHLSERPAAREVFLAAARRVESLRHPNLVGVLDVGFDETAAGPLAWIALELAAGHSLSEHVERHGALEPAAAVVVIEGVLSALEAAHAMGVVHRDVSPANVMVAPDHAGAIAIGAVRLLDFGLADAAGATTLGSDDLLSVEVTGRAGVIGNANYMSPEQARGGAVDARGDVYQAGAVLHFALTGRPPFPRDSAGQTVRAHLHTPPPVPSVTDARIPRGLDRVVVRAMLKDPADRFPTAGAMRAAVAQLGIARGGIDSTVTTLFAAPAPHLDADRIASIATTAAASGKQPGVDDITRVLGRTTVRAPEARLVQEVDGGADVATRSVARSRSRAGAWYAAGIAAVIVTAVILASAANSGPTSSIETQSSPSPSADAPLDGGFSPTPTATTVVEPVAALIPVPDLSRLTLGEAEVALAGAGLALGAVAPTDSAFRRDTVLTSSPAAGERLRAGSVVSLTVASGYNAIPDVAGQGRDAAVSLVQTAGFAPSFAYRAAPAGTPAGSILGTDPGPGAAVAVGTPVTVLEALPAPSEPSPTPTPTATPTPSRPTAEPTPTSTPEPGRP